MEEISVNGETYVKASVLAKNFGYTADYVGQLCRSGQVKATLVGRSWYVNEDSVREHRKGRYRSNSSKAKEHLRQEVNTRINRDPSSKHVSLGSRYETDESELFPSLNKPNNAPKEDSAASAENVAKNKDEIDTRDITLRRDNTVKVHRSPAPVLRTIPRPAKLTPQTSPATASKRFKQPVAVKEYSKATRRPSLVAAFALILGILTVESILLLGALGLEKKVMVTADNHAMVLYAFDANQALEPIKQAVFTR